MDLQKASLWKRVAAWMFDGILMSGVMIAIVWLLSGAFQFNSYNQTVTEAYETYEKQYGVSFSSTQDDYQAMTAEEQVAFDSAYNALIADEEAMYAYNMVIILTLVIAALAALFGYGIMDLLLPLMFGNGQTIGKKILNIGVVRADGGELTAGQLVIRTILGEYLVETMIPICLIVFVLFGSIGSMGVSILGAMLIAQAVLLIATRNHTVIHDLIAKTLVVDIANR